ncbi:MAG: hypothetical protein JJT89_03425 [Nitriliruptoraceae bacterium]|nr:hypothetical protein [Nitriliruptoraceae bacterium]
MSAPDDTTGVRVELRPAGPFTSDLQLVDEGIELARLRYQMMREATDVLVGEERWEIRRDPAFGAWRLVHAEGTELASASKDDAVRERFTLQAPPDTRWRIERRASFAHRRWEVLDGDSQAVVGTVAGRGLMRPVHDLAVPADAADGAVLMLAFLVGLMVRRGASAAT